jgi:hypothetical protein
VSPNSSPTGISASTLRPRNRPALVPVPGIALELLGDGSCHASLTSASDVRRDSHSTTPRWSRRCDTSSRTDVEEVSKSPRHERSRLPCDSLSHRETWTDRSILQLLQKR